MCRCCAKKEKQESDLFVLCMINRYWSGGVWVVEALPLTALSEKSSGAKDVFLHAGRCGSSSHNSYGKAKERKENELNEILG
jgi:hypothetical protein